MGPEHAPIGGRGETSHSPAISLVGLHPGQKMAAGRTLATPNDSAVRALFRAFSPIFRSYRWRRRRQTAR